MGRNSIVGVVITGDAKGAINAIQLTQKQITKLNNSKFIAAQRARAVSRQWETLRNVAAAYVGVHTVRTLVREADAWTNINARLRVATKHYGDFRTVQSDVIRIANENYASLDATATLYQRLARASKSFGVSQQDVGTVVETLTQALIVSGATTAEANNAMIQFAQGMASGALRGEEYRSVAEQAVRVTQALADSLGVNIGALREMAHAGELTIDVVFPALIKQSGEIRKEMEQMPLTLQRGMQNLHNAFTEFVGVLNETYDVTKNLAGAMQFLGENLDTVATIGLGVGAAFAGRAAVGMFNFAKGTLAAGGALALLGGPVGLVIGAAGVLYVLTSQLRDSEEAMEEAAKAADEYKDALRLGSDTAKQFGEAAEKAAQKAVDSFTKLIPMVEQLAALDELSITGQSGESVFLGGLEEAKLDLIEVQYAAQGVAEAGVGLEAFGDNVDEVTKALEGLGDKGVDGLAKVIAELEKERDMIHLNDQQRQLHNALIEAGVMLKSREGQKIKEIVAQIHEETAAREAMEEALERENEKRKEAIQLLIEEEEERKAGVKETQEYIEELQFEISILGKSNEEIAVATALRGLNSHATAEQKAQVEGLTRTLERERAAREKAAEATKQYTKIVDNMLQNIQRAGGDAIYDGLFGRGDAKKVASREFGEAMDELERQLDRGQITTEEFEKKRAELHEEYTDELAAIDKRYGNTFKSFTESILQYWKEMIAQMVAAWLTSGLVGLFTGQGLGGFSLAGLGGALGLGGGGGGTGGILAGLGIGSIFGGAPATATATATALPAATIPAGQFLGGTAGLGVYGGVGGVNGAAYTSLIAGKTGGVGTVGGGTAGAGFGSTLAAAAPYAAIAGLAIGAYLSLQGGRGFDASFAAKQGKYGPSPVAGGSTFGPNASTSQAYADFARSQGAAVTEEDGRFLLFKSMKEGEEGMASILERFKELQAIIPTVSEEAAGLFDNITAPEVAEALQDDKIAVDELGGAFSALGSISAAEMGRVVQGVASGQVSLEALSGQAEFTASELAYLGSIGIQAGEQIAQGAQRGEGATRSLTGSLNTAAGAANGLISNWRELDRLPDITLTHTTIREERQVATPFADGGIVTRPTYALIGEAGPEAVIPLRRGNNGLQGDFGGNAMETRELRQDISRQNARIEQLTAQMVQTNERIARGIEAQNRASAAYARR